MYTWRENVKIDIYKQGRLTDTTQFHNVVTYTALNWLADSLRTATQDSAIYYLAWGSSNLAVSSTQIALSSETGRKLITSQSSGSTGICTTVCYIGPTEAVGSISEVGWFAGSTASATADSGRMISRVLYSHTKTALESITVTRTDTFTT